MRPNNRKSLLSFLVSIKFISYFAGSDKGSASKPYGFRADPLSAIDSSRGPTLDQIDKISAGFSKSALTIGIFDFLTNSPYSYIGTSPSEVTVFLSQRIILTPPVDTPLNKFIGDVLFS